MPARKLCSEFLVSVYDAPGGIGKSLVVAVAEVAPLFTNTVSLSGLNTITLVLLFVGSGISTEALELDTASDNVGALIFIGNMALSSFNAPRKGEHL